MADMEEMFQEESFEPPPDWEGRPEDLVGGRDDLEYEDNQVIIDECKELFQSKDFIMEPNAIPTVKRFLNAGGYPEEFVDLLAGNYHGIAQVANLLADWLIVAGASVEEVQELVEKHLRDLIVKNFDPKKADSIFTSAGQPPGWIEEMIMHLPWRSMFYELADKYPDCLMLNFTMKLISDAGYQGEMTSACSQLETFAKMLKLYIVKFAMYTPAEHDTIIQDFVKACCHGKHMYIFAQCVLHVLMEQLEPEAQVSSMIRLSQELSQGAQQSGHSVWYLVLIFLGAGKHPRVFSALLSILEKRALNPGDMTVLYKLYTTADPPSVAFLRIPEFLDILLTALFTPDTPINEDHKPKYIHLLGYATSVYEMMDEGIRASVHLDELKATISAIERAQGICCNEIGSLQLTHDIGILYTCIRYPIVAMGAMKWVVHCLSEKNYAKVLSESTPLQLILLDEVSSMHPLQHELVFNILKDFYERNYPGLDTLVQLEFKKTVVDRMVHLLSRGFIMPVVLYMKECMERQFTDMSLLRHFVAEVLEMIAPPYSGEFIAGMLPIVRNEQVTSALKMTDGEDDVSKFLAHCENG